MATFHAMPAMLTAGAMLGAATICLTMSYAGGPSSTGNPVPAGLNLPISSDTYPMASDEEEEEREGIKRQQEQEHELQKERVEEAEEAKRSSLAEDAPAPAAVRAQLEVIGARDVISGRSGDPCVFSVPLPGKGVEIELRLGMLGSGGALEARRTIHAVASQKACGDEDAFFLDATAAPSLLTLCPSTCTWARAASGRLHADIVVTGM